MKDSILPIIILVVVSSGCPRPELLEPGPLPVFKTNAVSRVSIDSIYRYRFEAIDSLDRPVKFKLETAPSWVSFSESERTLSGKAKHAGQFPVRIKASNVSGVSYQDFMLTVFDKNTVNVLPIGNSITNGTDSADHKKRYASYRRVLWQKLHAENLNFDFIGSWDKHHMGGEVPYADFDMDHEGHSGWTANNIFNPPDWDSVRGNILKWLKVYSPDIVLVELGTNDVFQCRTPDDVLNDFAGLVKAIREKNPNAKFFISNVIPLGKQWSEQNLCKTKPYGELIDQMNIRIAEFGKTTSTEISPVISVDQFSGLDPSRHMYDDIHPNDAGEQIMAARWYEAIRSSIPKLEK